MRTPSFIGTIVVCCAIVAIVVVCTWLVRVPMDVRGSAAPSSKAAEHRPPAVIGPTSSSPWSDPSIDPAVLKRAFAPPPAALPPEARPRSSSIMPSAKTLQRMQRESNVAY